MHFIDNLCKSRAELFAELWGHGEAFRLYPGSLARTHIFGVCLVEDSLRWVACFEPSPIVTKLDPIPGDEVSRTDTGAPPWLLKKVFEVFDEVVQRVPDEFSENKDKEYETKFLERWRNDR